MYGDIVAHGEALRGLIVDPRTSSAILAGGKRRPNRVPRPGASRPHGQRRVGLPRGREANGTFLGRAQDRPRRPRDARRGRRPARRAASTPRRESWEEELERKAQAWRLTLARATGAADDDEAAGDDHTGPDDADDEPDEPAGVESSSPTTTRPGCATGSLRRARTPSRCSLLGLVRGGAQIGAMNLRRLFWARPFTPGDAAEGAERLAACDEDRLLLDSAVKSADGFFTTHFVSPYSKYIARWAARRGFTPNQVTTVSMVMGVLAAAGFATGERWGLVAGAVMLQIAFTTDCVDGQLARYTRQFSKFGAWLDSVFDRAKEYLAFAGLAIGASRAGDPVWLLACCAITLQTVRHMSDFSYGARSSSCSGPRRSRRSTTPATARAPPRRGARPSRRRAAAPANRTLAAARARQPGARSTACARSAGSSG